MKVIGIVGTRQRNYRSDFLKVEKAFLQVYEKGDVICSGLCPEGGDRFAVILHEKYKTRKKWFPAKWGKLGKVAGFIRNTDIAEHSDILIACVAEDRKGGTEDTIKKFIKFHNKKEPILV